MTEEEIKALQQELEAAQQEIVKQKSIKEEIVKARDEIKKKAQEYESKIGEFEQAVTKTAAQLEAERKAREDIAALHVSTLKVSAVREALEKEGAVAVDTALKLVPLDKITVGEGFVINKDTVAEVVTKLRETDSVLFRPKGAPVVDSTEVPKTKRASEGEPKAGFAEELKNCKTAAEVESLLRRHGKMA